MLQTQRDERNDNYHTMDTAASKRDEDQSDQHLEWSFCSHVTVTALPNEENSNECLLHCTFFDFELSLRALFRNDKQVIYKRENQFIAGIKV